MKNIITLFILLLTFSVFAQDKIYQHKVLSSNIVNGAPHATLLDHPDLNGNPNAKLVVKATQLGNQVVNNHQIDLFYSTNLSKWIIENTDFSNIVINSGFNIFIGGDSATLIKHSTNSSNTNGFVTQIDDPNFNNSNPGPFAIMTSTTTDSNRILAPFAFDYAEATGFRWIYTENQSTFPLGVDFNIVIPGNESTSFTHITNNANMEVNQTRLDHPLLNGNPDATFVFEHYYGINGPSTNIDFPHFLSSRYDYNSNQWTIYTTDGAFFVENVAFDVVIAPREVLGTEDNQLNDITLYPNPAKENITIKANSIFSEVSVYNILGQEVFKVDNNTAELKMDISNWATGTYFAKVQAENGLQTLKIIKN